MSSRSGSDRLVEQLLQSADEPRQQALVAAYQRYRDRITAYIETILPSHLRQRKDADDLALSAWGSFLRCFKGDRLDLEGCSSLWPLLAHIAFCKNCDLAEKYHSQKRDVARERSLQAMVADDRQWDLIAAGPSPHEEAAAQETVELIRARLGDERQWQILAMHLDGYLVREIATKVDVSESTVKRVLKRVRNLHTEITGTLPPS